MTVPLDQARFAVVDVETTGLSPMIDRVVEVGVVVTDRWGNVQLEYETLVNPDRDVGPTSIHGLTATMVSRAPRFAEIAGDLLNALSGSVWVGHNLPFDFRFLAAEYGRLGFAVPDVPRLCTMRLYRWVGPAIESHKLNRVCEACGVSLEGSHCAITDARATSQVLAHLLGEAEDFEIRDLSDLGQFGLAGDVQWMFRQIDAPLRCGCTPLNRRQAGESAQRRQRDFIQQLVERLRPTPETEVGDGAIGLYLNLLDRVLEDRRIDSCEGEQLVSLAFDWGLSRGDAERAHREYLGMLVGTALEDGLMTDPEMTDLKSVADLLAVPYSVLDQTIAIMGREPAVPLRIDPDRDRIGSRMTVCFTGETPGPTGLPMTRQEVTSLAESKGMTVANSVTKKLDVLVVADPETQSSKARKAREYGVRVVAAPVFWQEFGLS